MMKKKMICFLCLIVTVCGAMAACGKIKYNVDFYVDGTLYATVGTDGKSVKMPKDPVKDGVYFLGWSTSENDEGELLTVQTLLDQPLSESVHLKVYARFAQKLEVAFVTGTAEEIASVKVSGGQTLDEITPQTVPDGKLFGGWYIEASYSQKWNFSQTVTKSMTLYARWLDIDVTVTYDFRMESVENKSVGIKNGECAQELLPQTAPAEMVFGGWYADPDCLVRWNFSQPVNESVTLYARWLGEYVSVTFNFNTENVKNKVVYVHRGERADSFVPDFAPDYCKFAGWYREESCIRAWSFESAVTEDLTLYAKWESRKGNYASIKFVTPNNTLWEGSSIGEKLELPFIYIPEGQRLAGWFTDPGFTLQWDFETDRVQDSELYLYAKLEQIRVTLTFETGVEGLTLAPMQVEYGESMIFPRLKRDDYIHTVWEYTDPNGYTNYCNPEYNIEIRFTEDTVLKAEWIYVFKFVELDGKKAYGITVNVIDHTSYKPNQYTLTLPAFYNGKPVLQVEAEAFKNCNIHRLIIPDGIEVIGANAFSFAYNLEEIVLGNNVRELGVSAFAYCPNLKNIHFPQSSLTTIGSSAFYASAIENLHLPISVETVGSSAFSHCEKLKIASLGNVSQIGSNAFLGCVALREITIPISVETMGENVFDGCDMIVYAQAEAKPVGWSEDWNIWGLPVVWNSIQVDILRLNGVLYALFEEKAVVIRCESAAASVEIPSAVTLGGKRYPVIEIANKAFSNLPDLKQLSLPDTLEKMGKSVFYNTQNLEYYTDGPIKYLGNSANPYVVMVKCKADSEQRLDLTVRRQTRIVMEDASRGSLIHSLSFEPDGCLKSVGREAFQMYGRGGEIFLPSGIQFMATEAFCKDSSNYKIFVEEQECPFGWAENWNGLAPVYWDAADRLLRTEDAVYYQDGQTAVLVALYVEQENYALPVSVSIGGKDYELARVGKNALSEVSLERLFVPACVQYFEANKLNNIVGLLLIEAQELPDAWEVNLIGSFCGYECGITERDYVVADDAHYLLRGGSADAYRYTGDKPYFILPREIDANGTRAVVSTVTRNFIDSLSDINVIFWETVKIIPAGKTYGRGVRIFTTHPAQPAGWQHGWNQTFSGTIPVTYGLTGVDGTVRTYTFATDGSPVESVTGPFLVNEPNTNKEGMYFWGWYDNAAFEGARIEFPYASEQTVLYARFESEKLRDGQSFGSAIILEQGNYLSYTVNKPGQTVYFEFTLNGSIIASNYIIKSRGELDTYGIVYNSNFNQICAADSGGAGDNFSITCKLSKGNYYLAVKLVDSTQTGTFDVILSKV